MFTQANPSVTTTDDGPSSTGMVTGRFETRSILVTDCPSSSATQTSESVTVRARGPESTGVSAARCSPVEVSSHVTLAAR